jgi:RNA polymerase sigma factor (sigma-70 family)
MDAMPQLGLLLRHPVTIESQPDICSAADDDLYTMQAPLLRYLAIVRFNVPPADAEALVHDVFAAYYTRPGTIRTPRAYLVGAICNAARAFWRDRKSEEVALGQAGHLSDREEIIDEAVHRRLLVATALARIGKDCRDLLRRYYLNEETTATIAKERGTTSDYILFLLHRCRKRAREVVQTVR